MATFSTLTSAPEAFAGGVPIILYGVNMISAGGDVIALFGGDPSEADLMIQHHFSEDSGTLEFPFGIVFPNGCWTDSTGVTQMTIFYEKL